MIILDYTYQEIIFICHTAQALSGSTSILEGTNEEIEAILNKLREPIAVAPLQTSTQEQLLSNQFLL